MTIYIQKIPSRHPSSLSRNSNVCRCLSFFNKCIVMISISIIYMGILSPSILFTTMFCWQCRIASGLAHLFLFRIEKIALSITSRKVLMRSVRKKKISDLLQFDLSSTFVSEYDKFSRKFFSFFLSTCSWWSSFKSLSICENYFCVILVLGWRKKRLFLCERICGYERELMMMLGDRPSLIFLEMYPVNSGLYRSNFSTEARFYSGIFQKWITPELYGDDYENNWKCVKCEGI
mgnify:CR=1 FL=1